MTVRIHAGNAVVRMAALEAAAVALEAAVSAPEVTTLSSDGVVAAIGFDGEPEQRLWLARMRAHGLPASEILLFDAAADPVGSCDWLERADGEAWLRGSLRGEAAPVTTAPHPCFQRHEILSHSESGLHFVRERRSGILRQLTDDELRDFNDPTPCAQCGEQFGCEHFNVAGEPMLAESEIEAEVPREWLAFARGYGLSRNDLERLRRIESSEGEYHVTGNEPADLRTQELALLLNEAR